MAETQLAVLIDFENVGPSHIRWLLDQVSEVGRVAVKRAYGDWSTGKGSSALLELGIEPVQVFRTGSSGKNASDIRLTIDAIDLLHQSPVDVFVLASSDTDFIPLVSKLRAAGKMVIGAGRESAVGASLVKSCDRYHFLDRIEQVRRQGSPQDESLLIRAATTMLIAVPSAIKTFNWLGTMFRGSIRFTTPMLHGIAFVSMFVIGGLSGIYMANTPVDIYIHDTYYIVAHIHYVVFGGSLFAIFGGIAFWFPKMFGRYMNDILSKIHFWLTFIAFNCTFFPMHILGVGGHMRRISNPQQYEFLQGFEGMNIFITMSAFTLGFAQLILVFNYFWSMYRGKVAEKNPWNVNTLEWEAPTPVPHGNFVQIPTVYRGPYEYSVPGEESDFLPQAQPEHAPASAGD